MHLIPFTERGFSGSVTDHLLFKVEGAPIYVMDNHRLAMWCWFDALKSYSSKKEEFNLLHIDAHPDLSPNGLEQFEKDQKDIAEFSLDEYRNYWDQEHNIPLIRWDNYLTFFLKRYHSLVKPHNTFSATHKMGSETSLHHDILPHELVKFMDNHLGEKIFYNTNRWIVNLDIDYFFSPQPDKLVLFSDEYLEKMAKILKEALASGSVAVLSIALSPECCGSWEKAESLLSKMFDIRFQLE